MARSNLVSVGSIVNPFESLQRSAQNVSATYGDIADKKARAEKTKQEEARLEKQRVDNRFDRAQQLDLQSKQQAASDLDRKNRYDLLLQQDARNAQAFQEGVTDRQAARDKQAVIDSNKKILGSTPINVTFENLGPSVGDKYKNQKTAIDRREEDISNNISQLYLRRSFIDDSGKLSDAGQAEYDKRLAAYSKELAPTEAAKLAMQDITTARDAALASDYDKQAISFLNSSRDALETAKTKAAQTPTVSEYVNAGIQQLKDKGYTNPEEARAALNERAKSLGLLTEGQYKAADSAAEQQAYNRAKDKIGFLKDYYSLAATKTRNSGSTYKGMNTKDWNTFTDGADFFFSGDKENINELFGAVQKANPSLPIGVIREAIASSAIKGTFSDDRALDAGDPKNIKEVSEIANSLVSKSPVNGIKVTDEDIKKFEINLKPQPSSLSNRLRLLDRNVNVPSLDRLPFASTQDLRNRVLATNQSTGDNQNPKDNDIFPVIKDSVSSIIDRLPKLPTTRPGRSRGMSPAQALRVKALNTEKDILGTIADIEAKKRLLAEEQKYSNVPSLVRAYSNQISKLESDLALKNKNLNQLKQQLLPQQ
jgi:hypothetical protein